MLYTLEKYLSIIKALPSKEKFSKKDLLVQELIIDKQNELEMFYSPHNEYVNFSAKVVIIGITPGWTQMELAIRRTKQYEKEAMSLHDIVKQVKNDCRFAGSMRRNLIEMLDELTLPSVLGIDNCEELFSDNVNVLHTVSLIKYPTFTNKQNYTGHHPKMQNSPFLQGYIRGTLQSDIYVLDRPLIIPLGKAVEDVLKVEIDRGKLDASQCLIGFPHPSGANGHRIKQFKDNRECLQQ